ncbi:hypothetical protein FYK55_10790 [Roseiconus nitratireducens]|uniref:Uncharacterized protein n=1 Tax=Roseiconus nitratireducens TaxID=2605748 RepID=A0A5M6DBA7_9BACT|nr:hypothetical protein [Roseiconus nitratireducens]KAA5543680.1 hypothetical protein FYK55_10790 [Roseiconus nitratireducens]
MNKSDSNATVQASVRPSRSPRILCRWTVTAAALVLLASGPGCRLCCDGEDLAYPAYGGAWERTNRDSGRVGSIFDPGGARVADLSPRTDGSQPRMFEPGDLEALEGESSNEMESTESPEAADSDNQEQDDAEFQERLEEFRRQQRAAADDEQDIDVIPGQSLPPDLS